MTPEQQRATVEDRKRRGHPWHGPPHLEAAGEYRMVTAACYEHQCILHSQNRLQEFEEELLWTLRDMKAPCAAWCVLPNHYHILVKIDQVRALAHALGQLHGRTSFQFNEEDHRRGRRVWHRCQDRCMRSERHYYTSLNYIHHNPVKHGHATKWQEWPFSSAHWYLANKGRDWLMDLWREYPILDYGAKWDAF